MLITVNHAILHILDFNSGITVFSEQELDVKSNSVATFLSKHIEKSFTDHNAKAGTFHPDSNFKTQMAAYLEGRENFTGFSVYIADLMYTAISQSEDADSTDLIICDCDIDSKRVIALLKCNNKVGFIHQVTHQDEKIKNEIINHYAILPGLTQKLDEYALIEVDSLAIRFVDKKRSINGEEAFIFADRILDCSSLISAKETIKLVSSITKMVAENHGQSSVEAVSKTKNFIVENTEISEYLDPVELGKEVFRSSPLMQAEYIKEVQSAGLPETVKLDRTLALQKGKNHKIKTDTGIEITFPVDYFQNKEFIEFINNADGTLSIALKNIGSITNK